MAGQSEKVGYRTKDTGEGSSQGDKPKDIRDFVKSGFLETKNTNSYDLANAYYRRDKYTPKAYVTKGENRILGTKSLTRIELDEKYPEGKEFYRDNPRYEREEKITLEHEFTVKNNQTKERWANVEYYKLHILSHGAADQQYPHLNILSDQERQTFSEIKLDHNMDIKIDSTRMRAEGTPRDTIHLLLNGEKATLVFKSAPNPDFNCHSYLFTNGTGGWLTDRDVKMILKDYKYKITANKSSGQENINFKKDRETQKDKEIKHGDACLYYKDGRLVHSGKVLIKEDGSMAIEGKMGAQGIVEHPVDLPLTIKWDKWEIVHTDERGGSLPNLRK